MRHVTFIRQGVAPFDGYSTGAQASFDDAICSMLIKERFAKESKAVVEGTRLVRFVNPTASVNSDVMGGTSGRIPRVYWRSSCRSGFCCTSRRWGRLGCAHLEPSRGGQPWPRSARDRFGLHRALRKARGRPRSRGGRGPDCRSRSRQGQASKRSRRLTTKAAPPRRGRSFER